MLSEIRTQPVRSEQDYDDALKRVQALMRKERSPEEDDEFDVLVTLIESYEDRHLPMDAPDPIAAIRFRMQQLGMNQKDMVPIFGSRAKALEVLNGKCDLTPRMICALHEHLGIPVEALTLDGGNPLAFAGKHQS